MERQEDRPICQSEESGVFTRQPENLILNSNEEKKMNSSRGKETLRMTDKRHPPRRKTAPLQGGELFNILPH